MQKIPDCDVVVSGAGAAGIAAARLLHSAGMDIRVLEARDRPGGRAFTRLVNKMPLDMGCGWLHSAEVNPLGPIARAAGYHIDETDPPWQRLPDPKLFAHADHTRFRAAHEAFDARLVLAGSAEQDRPASRLLMDGCEWNPVLNAISTYVNGVELDRLSVHDVSRYHDSEINHRISAGLGTFISAMASSLPVQYGTPVTHIDHSGSLIGVETTSGIIHCSRVVVTVPTNLLASGRLRFSPELPDHLHAAGMLPLGIANKVFLAAEGADELMAGTFLIAKRQTAATGSYHFRPFGWPIIEGYFGGAHGLALESGGAAAFADQAIAELCNAMGSRWRRRLSLLAASAWASDAFAMGSYSHALPGHADKRAIIAQPHEGRIFFAGEATSPHFFSTVHGAWESGERAAREVLALRG